MTNNSKLIVSKADHTGVFSKVIEGLKVDVLKNKILLEKNKKGIMTIYCPIAKDTPEDFKMDFEMWLHGEGFKVFGKAVDASGTQWILKVGIQTADGWN